MRTNNCINEAFDNFLEKMNLQHFSNIDLADSKTTISNLTNTPVKCKTAFMVKQLNKYLCSGKKVASTSVKFQ